MRCINNLVVKCPNGWETKAAKAKSKVLAEESKAKDHSHVWRAAKDGLAELSSDKCWYCEMKQIRSDDAVDHFRPKSLYPWAAFDKTNFRYSCTYCNSKRKNPETDDTQGKGDEFPLFDPSKRAKQMGEERNESPQLLDPCLTQDPGMLDFLVNGMPTAKFKDNEFKKHKAEVSIDLYHLDHPDLIEKRLMLAADLNKSIEDADELFDQCGGLDQSKDRTFHGLARSLRDAMADDAELSTFARKIISGSRGKEWVQALLDTA